MSGVTDTLCIYSQRGTGHYGQWACPSTTATQTGRRHEPNTKEPGQLFRASLGRNTHRSGRNLCAWHYQLQPPMRQMEPGQGVGEKGQTKAVCSYGAHLQGASLTLHSLACCKALSCSHSQWERYSPELGWLCIGVPTPLRHGQHPAARGPHSGPGRTACGP